MLERRSNNLNIFLIACLDKKLLLLLIVQKITLQTKKNSLEMFLLETIYFLKNNKELSGRASDLSTKYEKRKMFTLVKTNYGILQHKSQ